MDTCIHTYFNGLDLGTGSRTITLQPTGESWMINFADSAACQDLKIGFGVGESRLFVGQKADSYSICSFFNSRAFFFEINDLLTYLEEAKDEFLHPSQAYQNFDKLPSFYTKNKVLLSSMRRDIIGIHYNIKIDPKRCYLVLDAAYRNDYQFFRNVCIPRKTEIAFEKYIHAQHEDIYIKMTPFFKF